MKRVSIIGILMLMLVSWSFAQRSLRGVVTDTGGEPLIGASVLVKGTTTGTITDFDGTYQLALPEGASVLIFSYTGFTPQEITIGVSDVVDVALSEGLALDEVIVTAQGIQKEKRALGYSVGIVDGEDIAQKSESDVTRLLKGRVAGVNVTSTSGVSGSGTNIIIRGYSSLTGSNQPLFIVDGVPFNTNTNKDNNNNDFLEGGQATSSRFLDLDPNNIASISVLKGLSATVTYGEQGRNGVVLITTKNGKGGAAKDKTSVTLSQSYFSTEIASLPDYQTNYGGGFHQNFGFFFSNWGPNFNTRGGRGVDANGQVRHPLDQLTDPSLKSQFPEFVGQRYNYQNFESTEAFFKKGYVSNTSLNIQGGTDKASFSGTFGYTEDEGFLPGNRVGKINIGIGGRMELANNLTLSSTINFVKTDFETPPISYGDGSGIFAGGGLSVFSDVFYVPRGIDLMGLPFEAPADNRPVYYRSGNDILNPRWTAKYAKNSSLVNRVFGQTALTYNPLRWLNLTYRLGIDTYTERQEYIVNRIGLASNDYAAINNGMYRTTDIVNTIWDHNAFASANFEEISAGLDLNVTAGFNFREDDFSRDGIESTNQLVFGFIEHSNFTNHSSVNGLSGLDIQSRSLERLVAGYASVTLDYKNYLYLNLSGRNDWSSTVEKENNNLFYPSASVSFIPTELMGPSNVLNYLKLRVGYGTSAGFPSPYSTRSTLSSNARQFIDRVGNVITTNSNGTYFEDNGAGATLGNPNLKPELHKEFEVGIDAQLFKNRVGIDLTLYQRNTKDLITNAPLDPSTGFTLTTINIGEIQNRGIELGLDLTPIQRGGFNWNLYTNFYAYTSKVLDLGEDLEEVRIAGFTNQGNFAIEGEIYGIMKGSAIERDAQGRPIIDNDGYYSIDDEIQVIGNPHPDFTTSLTSTMTYKGVTLSAQLEYRHGGDIFSGTAEALLARGLSKDTDFDRTQAFVLDGVTADGTPNTTMITATNLYFDNFGFGPDETSVYDATTIRIRDVTISYALPKSMIAKTPFGEVLISLSGQNLWYNAINLPKYTNVDTDALGFGADGNGLGFEFLNGPSVRRYGASLRLRF
ncbi:MAG: SusC/RagA family TonB-linked outer membrane protein [Saprospiraceae bacterium]